MTLATLGGFGYLLKDRVLDVGEFLHAAERVATGGSALDPKVVASLITPVNGGPLERLTERERDVLELIAQGLGNAAIATHLPAQRTDRRGACAAHPHQARHITEGQDGHRRVLAVRAYLNEINAQDRAPH